MTDFTTEIAALEKAIAAGAIEVRDGERLVRYDSFQDLLARLDWLKVQTSGSSGRKAPVVLGSFSRGET